MTNYNVTLEDKYPYTSARTGATGACQTTLLQSTKRGQVFKVAGATYVYPFNNKDPIMAVRARCGPVCPLSADRSYYGCWVL